MKFLILAIVIIALGYVYFDQKHVIDTITDGINMLGGSVDAVSLHGKTPEPFAPPGCHCKASFPVKPHVAGFGQQLFTNVLSPGSTYVNADKEITYYLSEIAIPATDLVPSALTVWNSSKLNSTFSEKPIGVFGSVTNPPQGNNELAQTNSSQSDAIRTQNVLDHFAQDWTKSKDATLETKIPIALGGGRFNGREIKGHLRDGKHFWLRLFCDFANTRMTIIGVVGKGERVRSSDSSRFIDSLEMW
jgi:hypothetical protein